MIPRFVLLPALALLLVAIGLGAVASRVILTPPPPKPTAVAVTTLTPSPTAVPTAEPSPTPTPLPLEEEQAATTPADEEAPAAPRPTVIAGPPRQVSPVTPIPQRPSFVLPTNARIRIPSVGINADIVGVGLDDIGAIAAPPDGNVVGWYDRSPAPGEQGNSIVTGHVDWGGLVAVFWRLKDVQPGDSIIVSGSGQEYTFIAEWSETYPADNAPLLKILGPTPDPVLTLITCEGEFDRATRAYDDRRVVRARLAG